MRSHVDPDGSSVRVRSEGAFTLLELVVAFVLIGIVVVVAASSIIRGFSGAAETATSATGRAKAAEAAERFGADVRGARSYGRDGAKIVDDADLQKAVQTDGDLYDINGKLLDWRDIRVAEGNLLTFQSDVVDEAAAAESFPECVTWSVETATGGWYLRRVTRAYTDRCATAGAVLEDEQITQPNAALPMPGSSGTQPLFRYVVADAAGPRCTAAIRNGPLTSNDMNRVVGIRIDFSSLIVHRGDSSRTALRDEIAIRSRNAGDYQYAMGCDEG